MQTYIAIIRGINVSGQKIIKMEDLSALMKKLHAANLSTYIQSGNLVFQSDTDDKSILETQIAGLIFEKYGFNVKVLVKDKEEWREAFQNNPFAHVRKEDVKRLYVTFMSDTPYPESVATLMKGDYGHDEFIMSGNLIYLFCPVGYGNTKLSNNFFENKLKVTATTRNWNTVTVLMEMADRL